MKYYKSLLTLVLVLMLSVSMTGCGSSDKKQASNDSAKTETTTQADKVTTTEKKTEASTEKKKESTTEKKTEVTTTEKKTEASTEKKTEATTAKKKTATTAKKKTEKKVTCSISCKELASHPDKLESNYKIPSGGVIMSSKSFKISDGDTVLDVLRKTGVSIDVDGGDYVAGIDGLYEFDGGKNSGWMYQVNDSFPNVSAKDYKLKSGDKIEWIYTVNYKNE